MSSTITSGLKCRAKLSDSLYEILPRWIGCQRNIYNAKTEEDWYYNSQRRLWLRDDPNAEIIIPIDQQYSRFKDKKLSPWLYEVPSQIERNGAFRWMTAKTNQLKGLAKAPTRRNKNNFNSVMITNELFRFIEYFNSKTKKLAHRIEIGTEKSPIGYIDFNTTLKYTIPNIIVVRRTASDKWYVSFCFEHTSAIELRSPEELAYEFNLLSDDELKSQILSLDRNVSDNCLADSNGNMYDFKPIQRERLTKKENGRKRHQRKLSRQVKGSNNSRKTKQKIAKTYEYGTNTRKDLAHQTSNTIEQQKHSIYAFEDLKIANMVRRPKAKKDPVTGKWMHNGRRAKAGLNKAILNSAWGMTRQYLTYKVARRNGITIVVPAAYSSQECSQCGHTHPDNRDRSRFVCQGCGFICHADTNAALVIKKRAFDKIRSGVLCTAKPKKRTSFKRMQTGIDNSGQPVEPSIRQNDSAITENPMQLAAKQELKVVKPRNPNYNVKNV